VGGADVAGSAVAADATGEPVGELDGVAAGDGGVHPAKTATDAVLTTIRRRRLFTRILMRANLVLKRPNDQSRVIEATPRPAPPKRRSKPALSS